MCGMSTFGPINRAYVQDAQRGRLHRAERWYRLHKYAYRRWQKARAMHHAARWLKVMAEVKRRDPGFYFSSQ